jgi:metal-responsive CopG/Arc/MetJ family transcriptional regulator
MLRELDERAARLNVSRQAVIKTLLDRALEQNRPLAQQDRREKRARPSYFSTSDDPGQLLSGIG